MARPPKITLSEETVLSLLNTFATIEETAKQLEIHPRTLSRYVRERFEYHCEWRPKPRVIDAKASTVVESEVQP